MSRYAIPLSFLILAAYVAFAKATESDSFRPRFYAFENGVRFGSFENEAQTLKQLGYDGISQVQTGGAKLAERIAASEKVGLQVLSVYLNVNDTPIAADLVKPLENRGAIIELTIQTVCFQQRPNRLFVLGVPPRWRGLPMENQLRPPGDLDRSPYGYQDVLL